MSDPKRIGIDLGALTGAPPPLPESTPCGGAMLYLSREEAFAMADEGADFATKIVATIPDKGRASIRLKCKGVVMSCIKTDRIVVDEETGEVEERNPRTVTYGLCARCGGYEMGIRMRLAKLAEAAANPTPESQNGKRATFGKSGG